MGVIKLGPALKRQSLLFSGDRRVRVAEEPLPPIEPDQILVQASHSAISPGTEMLVYRGQVPDDLLQDETIPALQGSFTYPFKYGYSLVGTVCNAGKDVGASWLGREIFAFQPHESHFITTPAQVIPLPAKVSLEDAVFLPNMESAVNFVMDGQPLIGEKVVVFGQGIVGLLTTALLAQYPLGGLVTLDPFPHRRQASLRLGAGASLDPFDAGAVDQVRAHLEGHADLTFELSGAPEALNQAIAVTGFDGRIVIGSWYGTRLAALDLGGRFHRSRIRLIGSQVSSLAPVFRGRWDKARRLDVVWAMVRKVQPRQWITHRVPFSEAEKAYQILDQRPESAIQVILTYFER